MQAIKNPVALELADGVRKTVARNDVVNDTLDRHGELLKLQNYFRRREQKVAQKAAVSAEEKLAEKMIITAFQNNVNPEAIEAMKKTARITDTRLNELKKLAQAV